MTGVDHWFITNLVIGIWHGLIATVSLVLSLFWNVSVFDVCLQNSWFYNLGLIIGVALGLALGVNVPGLFLVVLILALIIKLAIILALPVLWGLGIGIGLLFVYLLAQFVYNQYLRKP